MRDVENRFVVRFGIRRRQFVNQKDRWNAIASQLNSHTARFHAVANRQNRQIVLLAKNSLLDPQIQFLRGLRRQIETIDNRVFRKRCRQLAATQHDCLAGHITVRLKMLQDIQDDFGSTSQSCFVRHEKHSPRRRCITYRLSGSPWKEPHVRE